MKRIFLFSLMVCAAVHLRAEMSSEQSLTFADGLYRRGMYQQAAGEYETWLKAHTKTSGEKVDALFRLADCYERLNNTAKASALYTAVSNVTSGERRAAALLKLASVRLASGEAAQALPALEALVATPPEAQGLRDAALFRLGMCYEALERPVEARRTYQQLVEHAGEYRDFTRLRLAALTAAQGELKEALALYRAVATEAEKEEHRTEAALVGAALAYKVEDYVAATELYALVGEAKLGDQRALQSAAWAALRAGQLNKAQAYLAADRLRETAESDTRLFLAGAIASALGSHEEAKKAYSALLQQYPNSSYASAAAYEMLLITYKAGDPKAFLEAYKAVANILPKEAEMKLQALRLEAAVTERDVGQARAATALLVTQGDPMQMADAIYRLAWLEQHIGNWVSAGEYYLKVATTWPTAKCAPEAAYAAAYAFRQANNPDRASQALSVALATGDAKIVPQALMLRAREELSARNMTAASATLDEYLTRFPEAKGGDEARYLRGLIFFNAQDWVAAEPLLAKASQSLTLPHGRKVDAAVRRAQALHAMGRMEEAAEVLQPLIGLNDAAILTPAYLNWLVEFQISREAYAEAGQAAKQLLTQAASPADIVLANVFLGRIAEAQGLDATALAAYTTALDAAKEPTAYDVQAALGVGRLRLKQGNKEHAREAFTKVLAVKGAADSAELRRNKAEAYAGLAQVCREDDPDAALRANMNLIIFYDDAALVSDAFRRAIDILSSQGKSADAETLRKEWAARYPETMQEAQ